MRMVSMPARKLGSGGRGVVGREGIGVADLDAPASLSLVLSVVPPKRDERHASPENTKQVKHTYSSHQVSRKTWLIILPGAAV